MATDRPAEAIPILKRAIRIGSSRDLSIPLAFALLEDHRPDEAIDVLVPLWQPSSADSESVQIGELLSRAYWEKGRVTEAEQTETLLRETWPNDPEVIQGIASNRRRQGRLDEAIELLREALSYATGNPRDRVAVLLAETLRLAKRWGEAAEVYGLFVDTARDHPLRGKYLICLLNSGSYSEALEVSQRIRDGGPAIPIVSEVEANVLEHVGDLVAARRLREQLIEIEPTHAEHRIRLVFLCIRLKDTEGARSVLRTIDIDWIKDDAQDLFLVARARGVLGEPDVLPLAYKARKLEFGNPDAHLAYISPMLTQEVEQYEKLTPVEVGPNISVRLKRGDETRVFTLESAQDVNRERGELALTDSLAVHLLGHAVGDQIELRQDSVEDLVYEIIEIQSKYVFAFQETFANFSTWFPENDSLRRVEVGDNDFTRVFAMVDALANRLSAVSSLYIEKSLTLGAFSSLVGIPILVS